MRINIYAEELPKEYGVRAVERVSTKADTGRTFFGARIYLESPDSLHDEEGDDDRSAVTFWGPRHRVATLLNKAAVEMLGGILDHDHYILRMPLGRRVRITRSGGDYGNVGEVVAFKVDEKGARGRVRVKHPGSARKKKGDWFELDEVEPLDDGTETDEEA